MQSADWAEEHSQALREYLARGLSYSEIADAINARFNAAYSRNAAIGRAKRMGLCGPDRLGAPDRPKRQPKQRPVRRQKARKRLAVKSRLKPAVFERAAALKLRCIGIAPRHLALVDLEPGDCRYPYGGDEESEAITFCGHPRRQDSSYCVSHFHLTHGPGTPSERAATKVLLRLVEAA